MQLRRLIVSGLSIPGGLHNLYITWSKGRHRCVIQPYRRGQVGVTLAFLSALAEDERERITKRANEGRRIAAANGTKFGRKPKLTDHQRQPALDRMANGETCRVIALDLGVAHTTISRLR